MSDATSSQLLLALHSCTDRFGVAVQESVGAPRVAVFDDGRSLSNSLIERVDSLLPRSRWSKIQGLAGLRIGYGITTPGLASILQKTRQPFNANLLAQEAALAALADEEHQEKTKEITDEGRELLQNEFEKMGIEFVTSYANFVLIKVGDGDAVFEKMLQKGVIVRAMRGYKLPEWIRVSIGTKDENMKFLELLRSIITQ